MSTIPPAPFDQELSVVLLEVHKTLPPTLTAEAIAAVRLRIATSSAQLIGARPIIHTEKIIPGPPGAPDLVISIFKSAHHRPGGPGIYHTHGGGMLMGDRFVGMEVILDWVELTNAVAISVEYRLAPEHPDPAPVEDCYAGLVWIAHQADELGFDRARLLIAGASAGGGLAAGTALLARDRGGPRIRGQLLMSPMIDDRNQTVSSHQIDGIGMWDRASNDIGWNALLGTRRKTAQVSIYAAPARADDLSNLPTAFIDVGSAEVFRDEDVAYASGIWRCGGQAELHVWPGAYHGFDFLAPEAPLSIAARQARSSWVCRLFGMQTRTDV